MMAVNVKMRDCPTVTTFHVRAYSAGTVVGSSVQSFQVATKEMAVQTVVNVHIVYIQRDQCVQTERVSLVEDSGSLVDAATQTDTQGSQGQSIVYSACMGACTVSARVLPPKNLCISMLR